MQVTETSAEGLKREYRIVVPSGDLEGEIDRRLGGIHDVLVPESEDPVRAEKINGSRSVPWLRGEDTLKGVFLGRGRRLSQFLYDVSPQYVPELEGDRGGELVLVIDALEKPH